jgi:hypothetical protein
VRLDARQKGEEANMQRISPPGTVPVSARAARFRKTRPPKHGATGGRDQQSMLIDI